MTIVFMLKGKTVK